MQALLKWKSGALNAYSAALLSVADDKKFQDALIQWDLTPMDKDEEFNASRVISATGTIDLFDVIAGNDLDELSRRGDGAIPQGERSASR